MPAKSKKSKARKSSKPKAKRSSKPKMKKRAAPKKRVMAKRSGKPKGSITAIDSTFYGDYESTVEGISAMDGTLTIPASSTKTTQVAYVLDSDPGTTYTVTPNFNGNLISFSFTVNGTPYNYTASTWTPAASGSGGTWTGTASGPPSPIVAKGDWNAST
jgi:hypothetical protein